MRIYDPKRPRAAASQSLTRFSGSAAAHTHFKSPEWPAAHGQSVSLVQHLNRALLGETLGDPRLGGGSHAGEQVRLGGKASHPFGQHHSVARRDDKSAMTVRAHNFRNRADRGDDGGTTKR